MCCNERQSAKALHPKSTHPGASANETAWPPFWGPFLDPKTGAVLSAKFFGQQVKNSKRSRIGGTMLTSSHGLDRFEKDCMSDALDSFLGGVLEVVTSRVT